MKTEYDFTPEEKAALDEIDKMIQFLCRRKLDIYARARVKYITEAEKEINELKRRMMYESLLTNSVIKKDGIANLIFGDKEDCEEE